MELIIGERSQSYGAFMNGQEWPDYSCIESSLAELVSWMRQRQNSLAQGDRPATPTLRREGDNIFIDFTNRIGIVVSQILITCNDKDRGSLIEVLSGVCEENQTLSSAAE